MKMDLSRQEESEIENGSLAPSDLLLVRTDLLPTTRILDHGQGETICMDVTNCPDRW